MLPDTSRSPILEDTPPIKSTAGQINLSQPRKEGLRLSKCSTDSRYESSSPIQGHPNRLGSASTMSQSSNVDNPTKVIQ